MSVKMRIAVLSGGLSLVLALAASAAAVKLPADTVVAEQGGAKVTLGDVDTFAHTVPAEHLAELFSSPDRIESIVRNLLAQKQLLNEARQLKLQDKPKVQADMQQAANGVLVKARIAALRKKVTASVPDLSELAHERYLADPSDYAIPKKADVEHILIGTGERSDADAKALADKLYAQLKADPSQFDADVMKYSDDASKARNHGLIKNATSKSLVREFREAAGSLTKVGDISPPIKSQFGYHIIKLVKYDPGRTRTFADVKKSILATMRSDYIDKSVQHHLDVDRNRKLKAYPAPVASLRSRYADAHSGAAKTVPSAAGSAAATH